MYRVYTAWVKRAARSNDIPNSTSYTVCTLRDIPFFYPRPLPKDGGFYYTEEGSDFFIKEAAKKSSPLIVFSKGAAKNQPLTLLICFFKGRR